MEKKQLALLVAKLFDQAMQSDIKTSVELDIPADDDIYRVVVSNTGNIHNHHSGHTVPGTISADVYANGLHLFGGGQGNMPCNINAVMGYTIDMLHSVISPTTEYAIGEETSLSMLQ